MRSMRNFVPGINISRAEKKKITVTDSTTGQKKTMRILKNKPKKTRTAKRICIKCQTTVLHKLSNAYDSKICDQCNGV